MSIDVDTGEIALRANVLALELRRLSKAHVDSLSLVDAGAIESMAYCMAMGELLVASMAAAGRPAPASPRELAALMRALPFESAAELVLHPGRPKSW
jgi:hypothetical protein